MDEQVVAAMAKWPAIADVFGWLRLDRRGNWYLIDRNRPDFDDARDGRGSTITSPTIVDFIGRNYQCDERGRWYWQNGPQRVFVELDLAPLILRVMTQGSRTRLATHTGYPVERPDAFEMTDAGDLFVRTELGPGAVHDLDLAQLDFEAAADGDDVRLGTVALMGVRIDVLPAGSTAMPGFEQHPKP